MLSCDIILSMITITIPKELARRGDLVVIPRREYDALLKGRRIASTVQLTVSEKKALDRARKEIARGEFVTPKELGEEADTDLAIKIYRKEKQQEKLKTIKSLVDLD